MSSASDWIEAIAADGKKFFYHKVTRVSVWELPDDTVKNHNNNNQNSNNSNNNGHHDQQPIGINDWKEYKTDKGQKYYHNAVTGVRQWDAPIEFQRLSSSSSSTTISSSSSSPSTNNGNNTQQQQQQQQLPQQSIEIKEENPILIFKQLLTDNSISSICTFEKALKSIQNDERYQILKTMSERKQVYTDYQVDRKKVEQEEKRKKEKKNQEDFIQLLRDSKEVTTLISWRRASLYFESEPRWEAIESERERESLLHEYIQELEQQEKNQLITTKKEQMKILLSKLESDPSITVYTQWRKVRDQFESDEIFQILDKFDFLTVFENYIRDLEKRLDDQKRLEKEKLKKDSRKDRDNFRELLNQKYLSGDLHALTKWKSFKQEVEGEDAFINLSMKSIGSTPLELFSDFKEDLEIKYENDYKKLKEILKAINFKYSPDTTTLESLKEEFSKHQNYKLISEFNFLPYLDYLKYKEESREKNLAKKKKKRISQFKSFLNDTKSINKSSTWQDVLPTIESKKEYINLLADDPETPMKIFKEYIDYLIANSNVDDDEDEEGELILSPKKPLQQQHSTSSSGSGSSGSGGNSGSDSKKRRSYGDDDDRYYNDGGYNGRGDRDRGSDRDRDRDRRSSSYKKEKR